MPAPKPKPPPPGKAGLKKKLGPLPLWAWGGLAAAAVLLYVLMRRQTTQEAVGEPGVSLVTGSSGYAPPAGAFAGAPGENAAPAGMLQEDVLWSLAGRFADIESRQDEQDRTLESGLAGVSRSVDALTATVTLSPPSSGGAALSTSTRPAPKPSPAANAKAKAAPVRYYTFAPGKAPKGKKAQEIRVVKGKQIRFRKGHGYYYG